MSDPFRVAHAEELESRLLAEIAASGPITVERFMAEANAAYYAARDPLGEAGDFTTAPEISQMFGELVGLSLADLWRRAGSPPNVHYVELGPGRGTLAADALRAMRAARLGPPIALVETSPALRALQAERLPAARWHEGIDTLPTTGALLVVANEFFDALPIRQLVRTSEGWRERRVGHDGGRFIPIADGPPADKAIPDRLADAPEGGIFETSPARAKVAGALCGRLAAQGGAAIIVDYGHARAAIGDTFQAVSRHAYADPFEAPGTRDLTAHVDFSALAAIARGAGLAVHGPAPQGEWLGALGIAARTAALIKSAPDRADELIAARVRLTAPDQMGRLFKAMAFASQGWPDPPGF